MRYVTVCAGSDTVSFFDKHLDALRHYETLSRPKGVFCIEDDKVNGINVSASWFSEDGDLSELDKLKLKVNKKVTR